MVLGRKGKDVETFVDQLKAEGESEYEGGGLGGKGAYCMMYMCIMLRPDNEPGPF